MDDQNEATLKQLSDRLAAIARRMDAVEPGRLATIHSQAESLMKRVEGCIAHIEKGQADTDAEETRRVQALNAKMEKRKAACEAGLVKWESDMRKAIIEKAIADQDEALRAHTMQVDKLAESIGTAQVKAQGLEGDISSQGKALRAQTEQVDKLANSIGTAKIRAEGYEGQVDQNHQTLLASQDEALAAQRETARTFDELTESIGTTKAQVQELESEITTSRDTILSTQESAISAQAEQVKELGTKIEGVKVKAQELESEITTNRKTILDDQKTALCVQAGQVDKLGIQIEDVQREAQKLKVEIASDRAVILDDQKTALRVQTEEIIEDAKTQADARAKELERDVASNRVVILNDQEEALRAQTTKVEELGSKITGVKTETQAAVSEVRQLRVDLKSANKQTLEIKTRVETTEEAVGAAALKATENVDALNKKASEATDAIKRFFNEVKTVSNGIKGYVDEINRGTIKLGGAIDFGSLEDDSFPSYGSRQSYRSKAEENSQILDGNVRIEAELKEIRSDLKRDRAIFEGVAGGDIRNVKSKVDTMDLRLTQMPLAREVEAMVKAKLDDFFTLVEALLKEFNESNARPSQTSPLSRTRSFLDMMRTGRSTPLGSPYGTQLPRSQPSQLALFLQSSPTSTGEATTWDDALVFLRERLRCAPLAPDSPLRAEELISQVSHSLEKEHKRGRLIDVLRTWDSSLENQQQLCFYAVVQGQDAPAPDQRCPACRKRPCLLMEFQEATGELPRRIRFSNGPQPQ
ncbi:hypothetical protein B0T11DRAFT_318995 [Plectosphaerella cucumerina]|uniref:Uncharacterized protein n=1 Tax=Plectosphaerella cucumerina TaxID=40658 RepID=A0A8K0X103_9PEZI|nr:hypothetical protein B0T11DRAFT_318995 [Plectosphaerella cucumerina]